jgi:hypothetical protein
MSDTGPMIGLIARALQLWIRSQCDSADQLDLQLRGSALALLRGRLEGATLAATGVLFRDLPIGEAHLEAATIQAEIRRGGGALLQLREPFGIRGRVALPVDGLDRALAGDEWRWLGSLLAETLLDRQALGSLQFSDGTLLLRAAGAAPQPSMRVLPAVEDGALLLRQADGPAVARLPGDPAITLERAFLQDAHLWLTGTAQVIP